MPLCRRIAWALILALVCCALPCWAAAEPEESAPALDTVYINVTNGPHFPKRQYVAVVWGTMKETDGTITGHVGRSLRDRLQMCVFPDGDHGKHAVTHYHTLENLAHVAVVRCQLETGRTHQIRVHMKHIGHPLFNDARYGGDKVLRGKF